MRALLWTLLLALAVGCDDDPASEDCAAAADIVPACGITVEQGAIHLGESRADVEALLGPAPSVLDLGTLGTRFTYTAPPLAGIYAADDTVESIGATSGFEGVSPGGVGLGSGESAVSGEFGSAEPDPVLGLWWYPAQGIAWRFEGGMVTGVEVFDPR